MKYDSHFTFERIQIKSIEKARLFAELFGKMEVEFWIRITKLTLENCFICSEITDEELDSLNRTETEKNVRAILRQLR